MIAERPPIFVPSGAKGFKASYALTFATDLSRLIYLQGSLQGDAIEAKTLVVDNSKNSSACSVTLRGDSATVPAYTTQYISCKDALDCVVVGGSSVALINVDVLTYVDNSAPIINKILNVGGKPSVSFTKSGAVGGYSPSVKILSIGDPITSYVNLTSDPLYTSTVNWGFNSACSDGAIGAGLTQEINMDCALRELWFVSGTYGSSAGYKLIGG